AFAADIARVIAAAAWINSKKSSRFGSTNIGQENAMQNPREVDTRKTANNVRGSLAALSSSVSMPSPGSPGAAKRVNALTAAPASVTASGTPIEGVTLVDKALQFVTRRSSALGFASGQPAEFVADPMVQRTIAGSASVHLKQQYRGVPVFQMARTVRFDPSGVPIDAVGDNAPIDPSVSIIPVLDVRTAVRK